VTAADALIREAGWTYEEIAATELRRLILEALRRAEAKQSVLRRDAFPGRLAGVDSSSLSPDGNSLFYLPTSSVVAVLSTSTRSEKFRLEGHTDAIMWLGASPDGKLLATSSWDRTVKIWDLKDGSLVRTLKGTEGQNWSGSWSPDGMLIAVGSGDRTVRVWDVFSGDTLRVFGEEGKMFSGWVRGLAFEPSNGHSLIASSSGGTVRVFNILSAECTNLYQIDPVASSPLGAQIAAGFMEISDTLKYAPSSSGRFGFKPTDGRLVVYDTGLNEMWEFIQDKEGSARTFGSGTFVFSKDGKRVYSGDTDGAVRVWDLN
jgi:WD40 repeat protein